MDIYLDITVVDQLDNDTFITLHMPDMTLAREWLDSETFLSNGKRYVKFGYSCELEVLEIKLRINDTLYDFEQSELAD